MRRVNDACGGSRPRIGVLPSWAIAADKAWERGGCATGPRPEPPRHPLLDANAEGTNMVRSLFCLAALLLLASPAPAQTGPAELGDARYQFHRVEDGYLRLDVRTGQVSLCSQRSAGWACLTVADDRAALDQEIARLQNENVALKKALLERGLPLPGGVAVDRPAARDGEDGARPRGNADIDRMISTIEKVWRRLVEMIANLHKDMMKKT